MSSVTIPSRVTESQLFFLALITSVMVHGIILISLFYADMHYDVKLPPRVAEVVYQVSRQTVSHVHLLPQKQIQGLKQQDWNQPPDIFPQEAKVPVGVFKEMNKNPVQLTEHEKPPADIPDLFGKRQITVPVLKSDKITDPRYLNYHERIREKIRNRAYYYADAPGFQSGKVYLTFVLLSDGSLKRIRIDESRTHANAFLRMVGLRSIKESSPFPPFPPGLKYPELSFNILISFEVTK